MDHQNLNQNLYVVTGATSGIGLAVAEGLARQGAGVIGVGRSPERCRAAEARLNALNPDRPSLYLTADLSLQREVNALADEINAVLGGRALDGLVNNAGTFTYWMTLTQEGVETQFAVNHLAAFLLTRRLLPALQAAPWSRVVTVSSGSHYGARLRMDDPQLRRHYAGLRAYGCTKLANVLFSAELNRRLEPGSPVRAFAADPGLVQTDMGLKGTPPLVQWVWRMRRSGGISAEETARGILYLLTDAGIQQSDEVYWKHGQPKRPSRAALDAPSAAALWDYSERLCGLRPAVPAGEARYASQ